MPEYRVLRPKFGVLRADQGCRLLARFYNPPWRIFRPLLGGLCCKTLVETAVES